MATEINELKRVVNFTITADRATNVPFYWLVEGEGVHPKFFENEVIDGEGRITDKAVIKVELKKSINAAAVKKFRVVVRQDDRNGKIVATSAWIKVRVINGLATITQEAVSYRINPNVSRLDKGETVEFTIQTNNVPDGTELDWKIELKNMVSSSFVNQALSGTALVIGGVAKFSKTMVSNLVADLASSFVVKVVDPIYNGYNLATSSQVNLVPTVVTTTTAAPVTTTTTQFPTGPTQAPVTGLPSTTTAQPITTTTRAATTTSTAAPLTTAPATTLPPVTTVPPRTYKITSNTSAMSSGSTALFTVNTENVPNGTILNVLFVFNNMAESYFTVRPNMKMVVINNNAASFTYQIRNDVSIGEDAGWYFSLNTDSLPSMMVAESDWIEVSPYQVPTTRAPTTTTSTTTTTTTRAPVTTTTTMGAQSCTFQSDSVVGKGESIAFVVNTVNVPNGETLYADLMLYDCTVSGHIANGTKLFPFVVNNNKGEFSVSIKSNASIVQNACFKARVSKSSTNFTELLGTSHLVYLVYESSQNDSTQEILTENDYYVLTFEIPGGGEFYPLTKGNGMADIGRGKGLTVTENQAVFWDERKDSNGYHSMMISYKRLKEVMPLNVLYTQTFSGRWVGPVNSNPINLKMTAYKGGVMSNDNGNWTNPTATFTKTVYKVLNAVEIENYNNTYLEYRLMGDFKMDKHSRRNYFEPNPFLYPKCSATTTRTSVSRGDTWNVDFNCINIPEGTNVFWNIIPLTGNIGNDTFGTGYNVNLSDSFNVSGNNHTFSQNAALWPVGTKWGTFRYDFFQRLPGDPFGYNPLLIARTNTITLV